MRTTISGLGLALALAFLAGTGAAHAQSLADYDYVHLEFRGVGLDVGRMWANKVENTPIYGVRVDLGYLGPGVRIIPSLAYWRSRFTQAEMDALAERLGQATGTEISGEDLGTIRWSDLSLSLDGHFVWSTPLEILTYVGLGLGLHAMNGQGDAIRGTFVEDLLDSVTASVAPMAGVEFEPVPRLRVYGEGRYTLMNAIRYASARAGVQFMVNQGTGVPVGMAVPAPPLTAQAP